MNRVYETYRVASEGLTLSLIIWRRFRRPMPGMVEHVLDLNQSLADFGPILPLGREVIIPIDIQTGAVAMRPVVQLWD